MSQAEEFQKWAESKGAEVVSIWQESSRYTVFEMKLPDHVGQVFQITVTERDANEFSFSPDYYDLGERVVRREPGTFDRMGYDR